jgi:hypothetical protein
MEEVAKMKLYTMTRPSMPLTPACAPFAPTLTSAALAVLPAAERAQIPAQAVSAVPVLAAERAPVSWAHQVQVQAELAQALTLTDGINGTTSTSGFNGIAVSTKRYADGGSGVPPRGRPV